MSRTTPDEKRVYDINILHKYFIISFFFFFLVVVIGMTSFFTHYFYYILIKINNVGSFEKNYENCCVGKFIEREVGTIKLDVTKFSDEKQRS
jgi:hypothetical protein